MNWFDGLTWLDGWQGGLVLGVAVTIAAEVLIRWLLFRSRHRKHAHCPDCDGCLAEDGRAQYAYWRLRICTTCGDTMPCGDQPDETTLALAALDLEQWDRRAKRNCAVQRKADALAGQIER